MLFDNLFYMIVELADGGSVESFTLSEITEKLESEEEIVDVSIHQGQVYLLTTERCRVFKPEMGQNFTK